MTHTTDLKLSKELFELGLEIETEKWWVEVNGKWYLNPDPYDIYGKYLEGSIPAPSTDELLAVLPERIKTERGDKCLNILKTDGLFYVSYGDTGVIHKDKTISQALGLMAKWLLQNGWKFNKQERRLEK